MYEVVQTWIEEYFSTDRWDGFSAWSGFEELGSGFYSTVYALDKNTVVKITEGKDPAYARFVRTIEGHNNPHFPKIYYSGIAAGRSFYVMERLEADDFTDEAAAFIRDVLGFWPQRKTSEELRAARKLLQKNNLTNDLHSRNVMRRGSTLVITDPAC